MATQKKQHFIPKFILKNFSFHKQVYLYIVNKNKLLFKPVSYDSQFYENYFYGKDLRWEKLFSHHEATWSNLIQCVLTNKKISISDEDKLKEMVCFQTFRTKSYLNSCVNSSKDVLRHLLPDISSFYKAPYSNNKIEQMATRLSKQFNNAQTMKDSLDAIKKDLPSLNDLKLIVIKNKTPLSFILSDNPVIIYNFYQPNYGIGYQSAGILFIMPINTCTALLVVDPKMYPTLSKINELQITEIEQIEEINFQLFINSNEILISRDKESITNTLNKCLINSEVLNKNVDLRHYIKAHALNLDFFKINKDFEPFKDNLNAVFQRKPTADFISFKAPLLGDNFLSSVLNNYID